MLPRLFNFCVFTFNIPTIKISPRLSLLCVMFVHFIVSRKMLFILNFSIEHTTIVHPSSSILPSIKKREFIQTETKEKRKFSQILHLQKLLNSKNFVRKKLSSTKFSNVAPFYCRFLSNWWKVDTSAWRHDFLWIQVLRQIVSNFVFAIWLLIN